MEKTVNIPYALLLEVYEAAVYRAYEDPQTRFGGGRPEAQELVSQMNEFLDNDDRHRDEE
jgi:hypothetical protein